MPGYDRTGPVGAGPMSGGGRGLCKRENAGEGPKGSNSNCGFGRRRGYCGANAWRGEGMMRREPQMSDVERLISRLNQLESKLKLFERKLDESPP